MANEIKRVGLVFTQDGAVDFKKSLQEINLELNKNYNQFKLTQAQWDKSTTSTKKLLDQQNYLQNAYDIQSQKVATLRMQLTELESAENKDVNAIKKKRNELTAAEAKLSSYQVKLKDIESQLHNTGKAISDFGNKIENVGGKIESTGKKVTEFSVATAGAMALAAKEAIDYESAITGVYKTVDGTEEQLENLEKGIRDLAKIIPSSTTEIAGVAEAAGQLGIATDDILSFTKVMIDLGNSTNLSAEEAATSLAKFANITNMNAKDYDKLGSVIVALGNNFATTEADIVSMASRLAATGELTGLTESQIMAMATAMSSVGIEAEAGGSAMSKLLKRIQIAVETGNKDLNKFAKVAGKTSKEFKKDFQEDSVKALSAFIGGLNDTERNGKSAIRILEDMDIKEVRLSNTILSLANASDVMNSAVSTANDAWEDNTALQNEANKRYETLASKLQIALNKLKDFSITVGNKMLPVIDKAIDKVDDLSKWFDNLTDEQVEFIAKTGAVIVAIGPLLTVFGKVVSLGGGVVKTVGFITESMQVASGKVTSTSMAVNGLATVFSAITNPIGIACLAIGASVATMAIETKKVNDSFEEVGNGVKSFRDGINNAEGYLSNFNSTLFASAEEQQELANNMQEVQNGITEICKRAADERRGYTDEEIKQLDEYFSKLRDLRNRENEIQQQIAGAITQQSQSSAEAFEGSLEEYKSIAQEWIKTARDQRENILRIIEDGTIQEVALLNQRFKTEEEQKSEAYKTEYNKIMEQKQEKINAANDEVRKVTEVYANGYAQRANQEGEFYEHLQHYNWEQEQEENRHNSVLESIKNNGLLNESNKLAAQRAENERHNNEINNIWKNMYKNMSESEAEQLGVWLAMVTETQMYGGQISDEAQRMANSVVDSYDSMPKGTREKMKQAMDPMLDEMKKAEPSLFAKATSIGNGIISRLKKAFDEHSPSKETRKIMKFAMQPMEEEMEDGKKQLLKDADEIGNGIVDRLSDIDGNVNFESNVVNSGLRNSNLNFEFDYERMANIFSKVISDSFSKIGIFIDKNALVGYISPGINRNLGQIAVREERGG